MVILKLSRRLDAIAVANITAALVNTFAKLLKCFTTPEMDNPMAAIVITIISTFGSPNPMVWTPSPALLLSPSIAKTLKTMPKKYSFAF
eukprot:scaffold126_cov315-Pavlova_lutheri.AAC.14